MSIPLPPIYHLFQESDDDGSDGPVSEEVKTININDIYLDADERYEIFQVKAAERPHLLNYNEEITSETKFDDSKNSHCHESKDSNGDNHESSSARRRMMDPPPLIDGCDVPGWRKEQLVMHQKQNMKMMDIQALLNIGPSSKMFRLESQWPNVHKIIQLHSSQSKWNAMKTKLSIEPNVCDRAIVVNYDDCCQIVKTNNAHLAHLDGTYCSYSGREGQQMATKFALEFEQPNIPAKIMGATKNWLCITTYSDNEKRNDDRSWR